MGKILDPFKQPATAAMGRATIKNAQCKIAKGGFTMKGFIKDKKIILTEPLPEDLQDGDEVEISIIQIKQKIYPFPVFDLGVKDKYLNRENIYESGSHLS